MNYLSLNQTWVRLKTVLIQNICKKVNFDKTKTYLELWLKCLSLNFHFVWVLNLKKFM